MIFISYRIADANDLVGHLDESLTAEFGPAAVFRDRTRLQGGQDWPIELEQNAKSRPVMLVVIGKTWKSVTFTDGEYEGYPRLHDPNDWVRKEITTALDAGNTVIPVFANGATMPKESWLDKVGLKRLADKQGIHLRTDDYADDFAKLVALLRKQCPALPAKPTVQTDRAWQPAVLYPLQPAPHFQGREEVLADLTRWARDASDHVRVLALVAAGGVGKTAIAERVLAALENEYRFGVLVWSFYENPQTEAFLRAACQYFTGQEPKETGGLLERLQQALTGSAPHLLILDGLERVQATGDTGRPRGELEDPLLKRLLRWLAAGHGTHARALITSRFPLPDLRDWLDDRFREEHLDDLPPPAALGVLRGWGVKGTDAQLLTALGPLQDEQTKRVHALSVSVLGSYLGKLWDGDVTKAPTFDLQALGDGDPKAAKLTRILTNYAEKLPAPDRDLLARLSMFPRGVTIEIIGYLVDAGGEVAGHLIGCNQVRLLQMLEGLRDLGLVFRYETSEGISFTAHPFLRQFFAGLHGAHDPQQIHEAVRARLAPSLEERPDRKPTDARDLDRYERLIEVTRFAGQTERAFDLFLHGLGAYKHLGWVLGEYTRILRILPGFSVDGTPPTAGLNLPDDKRARLAAAWGLASGSLGDLNTARRAFEIQSEIYRGQSDDLNLSIGRSILADVELAAGRFPAARTAATVALTHAEQARSRLHRARSHARAAAALLALGRLAEAKRDFQAAAALEGEPLYSDHGLWEGESKLATGDREGARSQTEANQATCRSEHWTEVEGLCDTLLGRCALPHDSALAHKHLAAARRYASRTGHIEVTLRCYHLAAEIARHEQNYAQAVTEAINGIQLADSCGFGRWSIDIRLELAKVYLAAGQPQDAIEPATKALAMSEHPECQYAWGIADALHLLGVAHARLNDPARARDYLQRALAQRQPLEHPELAATQAELARLP